MKEAWTFAAVCGLAAVLAALCALAAGCSAAPPPTVVELVSCGADAGVDAGDEPIDDGGGTWFDVGPLDAECERQVWSDATIYCPLAPVDTRGVPCDRKFLFLCPPDNWPGTWSCYRVGCSRFWCCE